MRAATAVTLLLAVFLTLPGCSAEPEDSPQQRSGDGTNTAVEEAEG